ncbi:MAG: endoribonuclease YbeY [Saprospiraceae bacterium]|nr:MAG: endoribonuclease YbeY [Saprospiraceae bacterium]
MSDNDGLLFEPEWPSEAEPSIEYYSEDIDFDVDNPTKLSSWITSVIEAEKKELLHLNFIFSSDNYLHQINLEYLNHDTFTDIITFPYSDPPRIHGDIFISIERIRENAHQFKTSFSNELHRVMIHGVLHLCGYGDKLPEEKSLMTKKENGALQMRSIL